MGKKLIFVIGILLIIGLPVSAQSVDFNADATLGCDTLTVQFTDLSSGATSWEWDFGDGTTSDQQTPPPHVYTNPGIYDVELRINSTLVETKDDYIKVIARPNSDFWYSDTMDLNSLTYVFRNAVQEYENMFDYNRLWLLGDGSGYTTRNFAHTFADTGSFQVELEVYADLLPQCNSTTAQSVLVRNDIYIPNVFSPDDSGINDLYIIEYNGVTNLNIFVYSRFGNLVFKSISPVIVWDGTGMNGQEMNEGVYYYVLTSEDGEISKSGFIHLYR